jgi:luciferase family oxidoreductase group 1
MQHYSYLDLAPIPEGQTPVQALKSTVDLAQAAEKAGFHRYWLAEHHNMPGIASAATPVLIGHVAGHTKTMRIGAGGIMLPNHSPLVVAEQFGTLATLYPNRIDLGLGRAPGTDMQTARALRRHMAQEDTFPQDVQELIAYLGDTPGPVQAIPGTGTNVPVWILGSSTFGAQLAAYLGLPYAFASHFAPADLMQAIEVYRARFTPSPQLERPFVMLGANVIAAGTDAEARLLLTSLQQAFVQLRRGRPTPQPPPLPGFEAQLLPHESAALEQTLACSFVGSLDTVRAGLDAFVARTRPDELILASHIHDHAARLRSYELVSTLR